MFAPAVLAIVLFWCAVIHGDSVGRVEMMAMLPAMIAVCCCVVPSTRSPSALGRPIG